MNDENTEYHEPTEKVDTSQYDLYPDTSLPDVPQPPPLYTKLEATKYKSLYCPICKTTTSHIYALAMNETHMVYACEECCNEQKAGSIQKYQQNKRKKKQETQDARK